jgi:hypothetical protein
MGMIMERVLVRKTAALQAVGRCKRIEDRIGTNVVSVGKKATHTHTQAALTGAGIKAEAPGSKNVCRNSKVTAVQKRETR